MPANHQPVTGAQKVLSQALAQPVPVGIWRFPTDGRHAMPAGVPAAGLGPGDPALVHISHERMAADAPADGLTGYLPLATDLLRDV